MQLASRAVILAVLALSASGVAQDTPRRSRTLRTIDGGEFEELARPEVDALMSPCRVDAWSGPREARVDRGDLTITVEGVRPTRTGRVGVIVVLASAGRESRIPVNVGLTCPPPVVQPRSQVRVIAQSGNVIATAPGEAKQPGQPGDIIAVVTSGGRRLRARVVDAGTVEVVQ